jgi:hypothetical protein
MSLPATLGAYGRNMETKNKRTALEKDPVEPRNRNIRALMTLDLTRHHETLSST